MCGKEADLNKEKKKLKSKRQKISIVTPHGNKNVIIDLIKDERDAFHTGTTA